ncbi:MAG: hypothetical protein J6Z03_05865 [Erysipelotrichaceae bacterium]|nr:hypothetical protein [Erysipelotrichaceae bacterium]
MRSSVRKKYTVMMILLSVFILCSCQKETIIHPEPSDVMYSDRKDGEVVYVFQMDGEIYMIDPAYRIDYFGTDLEDGKFYELTADITYLNGGVAGYVNFPEINNVISCKEISPFDLDLPDIKTQRYGLTLIGDYAEGDIFLHEYMKKAVWKDGEWIWKYDKDMDGENGTLICYRSDVSTEDIEKGISEGVLSCAEYFVQPAIN